MKRDTMKHITAYLESVSVSRQNVDLQSRVNYLEGCECVRRRCVWEGREVEEGQRWQTDPHNECSCTSGKVVCQANSRTKGDAASVYLSNMSLCVVSHAYTLSPQPLSNG